MPDFRNWLVVLLAAVCLLLFSPFLAMLTGIQHLLKVDPYGVNGFTCVGCLYVTPITLFFYAAVGVLIFL